MRFLAVAWVIVGVIIRGACGYSHIGIGSPVPHLSDMVLRGPLARGPAGRGSGGFPGASQGAHAPEVGSWLLRVRRCGCVMRQAPGSHVEGAGAGGKGGGGEHWKQRQSHGRSKRAQQFNRNRGLLYVRNFLTPEAFEGVQRECKGKQKRLKAERSSFASGRVGTFLERDGAVAGALLNHEVASRLEDMTGGGVLEPSDYPLELRSYPPGSMMEWHVDELLYDMPQLELVLTVFNDGDSVTQWRDGGGVIREEWTEPNSLLVIQAGGAEHRVTPIKRGGRQIVKAVYCMSGAKKLEAFKDTMQF